MRSLAEHPFKGAIALGVEKSSFKKNMNCSHPDGRKEKKTNEKRSEAKERKSRVKENVWCYFFHNGLNPDPVFMQFSVDTLRSRVCSVCLPHDVSGLRPADRTHMCKQLADCQRPILKFPQLHFSSC